MLYQYFVPYRIGKIHWCTRSKIICQPSLTRNMCILFVYINSKPQPKGYKLIVASNRDEFYSRPAAPAAFWPEIPHVLGGMDMEPGKEGGTWLAMNTKTGKIGCLLNITTNAMSPDKRGRGSLVTDYINSNGSGQEYGQRLKKDADHYNPFNLVMIDFLRDSEPLTYYSSASAPSDDPLTFNRSCVYGFGNSLYHTPYAKVENGRIQIENLMQSCGTTDKKDELVAGLLDILKSPKRHYPDPQLSLQTAHFSQDFQKGLSSTFVHIPLGKYGSRTHTIILVDEDNSVNFMEWTMAEPINDSKNPSWIPSNFLVQFDRVKNKH